MGARDDVQTMTRAANAMFAETWQYRQRTDNGTGDAAYGTWTDISGHETQRTWAEEYDEDRDQIVRRERSTFRTSDADTVLVAGDQLKDTNDKVWQVRQILSAAVGTRRYEIEHDNEIRQGPDRGAFL